MATELLSNLEHALDCAGRGWHVFPAPPGKKQGYKSKDDYGGRHWGKTVDPAEIEADWTRWPNANIGIACGPESGLFVIEADTIEGHGVDGIANLDALAAQHGGLPDTIEAISPSGSRHLYFRWPEGVDVRNRAGLIAPGIDVRGDGGMVIAPPSIKPGKPDPYRWVNPPGLFDLAECPDWLLAFCFKEPGPPPAKCGRIITGTSAWAEAALRGELTGLANAANGSRNDALNIAAMKLSQIVAGGHMDESEVKRRLHATAAAIGLDAGEIGPTIESGFAKGMTEPRHPPEQVKPAWQGEPIDPAAGSEAVDPETGEVIEINSGVTLSDFRAHMPAHNYIFAPSGEFWPATSVNARIPPIALHDANGEPVLDDKGRPKYLTAAAWLDQNKPVEQLTWAPGEPQVVTNRLISDGGWITRPGCAVFNHYRPPVETSGDATKAGPWLAHIRKVYPEEADHLIHWLAHRVQRPAEKINHAIVMGGSQGIGKDTILEPVKAAIGPWNFAEVSPQNLLGRFNGFVKSVILRVSEARDLGDVDRFAFYDHMKTYTAAPPDVLRVDEKHLREYSVFNVCGVIITTNHKTDGIFLPADDRQHYVAWSDCTRDAFPTEYWNELYGWYREGGTGHVMAYLRSLDLRGFDAKAPPPKTAAFWDIVASNQAPEDAELADALERLGWPPATTVASITTVADTSFAEWLNDRRNSRRIPHRLEECGYRAVRCPSTRDGRWKVAGRNVMIYARRELATRDAIAAAERYAVEVRKW